MVNLVLPSKYAEALFEIAKDAGITEKVREEIIVISKVFDANKKLKAIMNHPGISREEKKNMIRQIFGEQISKTTVNFMLFLIDKKRERLFEAICDVFVEKVEEEMGVRKITIETAYKLEPAEKDRLVRQLESAMKKKLKVDARVNAGMLGGIIIRERMKLIDASVIQFLNTLKSRLHNVKVSKPKQKAKIKKKKSKIVKKKTKKKAKPKKMKVKVKTKPKKKIKVKKPKKPKKKPKIKKRK